MKCGAATLRQTVTVLHNIYIAHMTFIENYIISKSFFKCHQCITIVDTILMLLCVAYIMFYT